MALTLPEDQLDRNTQDTTVILRTRELGWDTGAGQSGQIGNKTDLWTKELQEVQVRVHDLEATAPTDEP